MGTKAEEQHDETEEQLEQTGQPEDQDEGEQQEQEGEEAEQASEDAEEVEIVAADDPPSSSEGKKRSAPPRRVRRLLEQKEQLNSEKEQIAAQNRLLRMQLEKVSGKSEPDRPKQRPTLESVGYDETKYQEAMEDYLKGTTKSVLGEELSKAQQKQQEQLMQQQRHQSLEEHYKRTESLRVPDYDTAEEKAMEYLGREAVEDIAANVEDSHLVLYYLGKNPTKAAEIKTLLDNNPVRATYALGKLSAGLTTRPKTKPAPNPDKPVDAGGPSSGGSWEKQLEKARTKAAESGDFSHVQKVKKAAKEAGVNL